LIYYDVLTSDNKTRHDGYVAKKNSLFTNGSLKDLVSSKMLTVYAVFLVALYFILNSFAAAEATNSLLSSVDFGMVNNVPGVRWTTSLSGLNGTNEVGRATLIGVKNQTKVIIYVVNEPKGAVQPAHIHVGNCPKPGAVVYPLTNVVNGNSVTLLDVKLSDIQNPKMGSLAVNVHESAAKIGNYVSCGNLR